MATTFDGFRKFERYCTECGKPAYFFKFNEQTKMEELRCAEGHITEIPEKRNDIKR
jgi:hypothetical protein